MTDYKHYLNDEEIEEPIGFADLEISIKRDDKLHGMTFEASTSPLQFFGLASTILQDEYELNGVKANVIYRVEYRCEGNYDYAELYRGRLNFGKYKRSCGATCLISLPVEEESCHVILNARYDQKVDIDSLVAADGVTPLPDYEAIGVETELPAHELLLGTQGQVAEEGDIVDLAIFANGYNFYVRPTYQREINASLDDSQLIPSVFAASDNGLNDAIISPALLLNERPDCVDGDFSYSVVLKGSFDIDTDPAAFSLQCNLIVAYGEFPDSLTELHNIDLGLFGTGSATGSFNETLSGSINLPIGQGFYVYFKLVGFRPLGAPILPTGNVTFDPETYINIEGVQACPPTPAELSAVHETLSRVTESITNGCVRVKSEYYGRTDSEPFAFSADGCGGLRTLTSGLKIRNAEQDKFFASLKDLIEGLNPIDNIGMGLEDDPDIPGQLLLRVEALDHFYQNTGLLTHNFIPDADLEVEETKHYNRILVGYKKWEVEKVKGLDEFNSTREYKTSIDTINSTLDITSDLVAGSYAIELTRQQSFIESGGADTKFDNDIFIISMTRSAYPYGTLQVELGNIQDADNIFSPETIYNFRLSPLRNLMRWYRSIVPAMANIFDSDSNLRFSAGTGNLVAEGRQESDDCRIENATIQENQNIFVNNFLNSSQFTPLWKNELLTYEYPMSVADYAKIKANPYGYIEAQCGTGSFEKFWIQEIKFKLTKGSATFILRKKWQ